MIEKILLAAVAGLFGLAPAILQWISEQNKSKSRSGQLARLFSEMQFLNECTKIAVIFKDAGTVDQESQIFKSLEAELRKKILEYSSLRVGEHREILRPEEIPILKRYFLLFLPSEFNGWVVHSIFYSLSIFTSTLLGFILIYGDIVVFNDKPLDITSAFIIVLIIAIPFLVLLQKIGWHMQNKRVQMDN